MANLVIDSPQLASLAIMEVSGVAEPPSANGGVSVFSYTLNGVSQVKSLALFEFATPVPRCTFDGAVPAQQATNYQDMWFVPAESGWGINLAHQGDIIFASWFIYDKDGNPTWVSATLTKASDSIYAGGLDATSGPPFDSAPFDSTRATRTNVGSAALSFIGGGHATFTYTLNGISGVKTLTRFVFDSPGTVCESRGELAFARHRFPVTPSSARKRQESRHWPRPARRRPTWDTAYTWATQEADSQRARDR